MNRDRLGRRLAPLLARTHPDHPDLLDRLLDLAEQYAGRLQGRRTAAVDHRTACLITYAGTVRTEGEPPLQTLRGLLDDEVGDLLTDVHLLPMFPWTSDDGFGVVDHRRIDPAVGTWDDVARLAERRGLMFDFVANHTSASAPWFAGWLAGEPAHRNHYLARDPDFDTSHVVRPRTSPLFHRWRRPDGRTVDAWTTFGPDQVDVNVAEPEVLLELTDVLLGYFAHGASAVRLDAIGFLWKESGTTCLHLPQTHAVIKAWRAIVDEVLPGARLVTETNVPHVDNISYFGNGEDEANMVYQFALPPLVLHAFVTGRVASLAGWAAGIGPVSRTATWFNFLASHDGIGLRPTHGILTDEDRQLLVDRARAVGGTASMASGGPDGTEQVYELNVSYLDALCRPDELSDPEVVARKAVAAHAILLAMIGLPAIYLHSLVGSGSDREGMLGSGINRRINRAVLDAATLRRELREDPRRRTVFAGLRSMLAVRREHPAFTPYGTQAVLDVHPSVLALRRGRGTVDELLCLVNVADRPVALPGLAGTDVLTGRHHDGLELGPHGVAWLAGER